MVPWQSIVVICALLATATRAQIGSVQAAETEAPTHAWALLPADSGWQLTHIPPRDANGRSGQAEPGAVRPSRALREKPEAIAGVGDRVYLVFPPTETPSGKVRRVLTARSVPAGVKGMWADLPIGVFDLAPSLPGDGALIGLGVMPGEVAAGSLHALVRYGDRSSLLRMGTDDWTEVPTPPDVSSGRLVLLSHETGLLLASEASEGGRAWTLDRENAWVSVDLIDWPLFWGAQWRVGVGREVLAGVPGPDGVTEIWSIGPTRAWKLGDHAAAEGVIPDAQAMVALPSSGRLVVVGRSETGEVRVSERSLTTGRLIYEGDVVHRSAVGANEFRLIALMLLSVMIAALLVIIRPSGESVWTVPEGWALCDPGRRLVASLMDLLLVLWVVTPAFNTGVREVLTLQVLITPDQSWLAIPACMIGGALSMGVWEGLLGYSPGKFLCGVRVYRGQAGEPQKLGVFWGLVRSTIKWVIPPVAALVLIDPGGRHRGDAAARAVVVVRAGPQGVGEADA